jgi:hypothetical protein
VAAKIIIRVSDHAVLRFLERVHGFDVEAVRRHIEELCAPAMAVGASSLRAEGVRFGFSPSGTVVTTVMPDGGFPSRTHQDMLMSKVIQLNGGK